MWTGDVHAVLPHQSEPAVASWSLLAPDQHQVSDEHDRAVQQLTQHPSGAGIANDLAAILDDTPLSRLRAKEQELADEAAAGESADPWHLLGLQQELLALAKVHALLSRHKAEFRPLLLPTAHFQLAQRYSDLHCVSQATDHLQRAIHELPPHGQSQRGVQDLMRKVNVCMAQALLKADPPKPQVALQHLLVASGRSTLEDVDDLELGMLISQALALMGDTRLDEARSTRLAIGRLTLALDEVDASLRKAKASKRTPDEASLRKRMGELQSEVQSEEECEVQLVEQAVKHFDKATEMLYNVTQQEERRLEEATDRSQMRRHPRIQTLRRQLCELSMRLAKCYSLAGNTVDQERSLGEVLSAHETYGCVPLDVLADVLKELGAVRMRNKRYDEALYACDRLREVQEERLADAYAQKELAVAECYKLSGDVFVAMREFARAREHFEQAHNKFVGELGPVHQLTLDLEHRMRELEQYTYMSVAGAAALPPA